MRFYSVLPNMTEKEFSFHMEVKKLAQKEKKKQNLKLLIYVPFLDVFFEIGKVKFFRSNLF